MYGVEMPSVKQKILAMLTRNDQLGKLVDYLYSNPVEKYSLRLGILCVFAAFSFVPFEDYRIFGGFLALIAAALFVVYTLASVVWNLRLILTPTKTYFTDFSKRVDAEDRLVAELAMENPQQLDELLSRLRFEKESLANRIGFLFGAVDKLGMVPAILALYMTYAKANADVLLDKVPYPLLGFVAGVYTGCFVSKHIIDRIGDMIFMIESAKTRAEAIQETIALLNSPKMD